MRIHEICYAMTEPCLDSSKNHNISCPESISAPGAVCVYMRALCMSKYIFVIDVIGRKETRKMVEDACGCGLKWLGKNGYMWEKCRRCGRCVFCHLKDTKSEIEMLLGLPARTVPHQEPCSASTFDPPPWPGRKSCPNCGRGGRDRAECPQCGCCIPCHAIVLHDLPDRVREDIVDRAVKGVRVGGPCPLPPMKGRVNTGRESQKYG